MRTLLYGLILSRNAQRLPAHMEGVRGARLQTVQEGAVTALVSDVDDANAADLDHVRAHDHVLRGVVRSGVTAIPVRFGQTFADDAELRRHLGANAPELAQRLEEMDGLVEMRLLMTLPEESPTHAESSTTPGRAYLESLRPSRRVAGLGLRAALGPVVRAEHVEELPREAGVAFAHLIRRDDETSYREAVGAHPSLSDAKVIGPLALHAFAHQTE